MNVKIVYGCPCSGKSTYVRDHAKENDLIYDYEALLTASSTRKEHLTAKHAAHMVILALRESMLRNAKDSEQIDTIFIQCRWPTDWLRDMCSDYDTEEIYIKATKEECYERLEHDETRPDKDEWKAVIDSWFEEHEPEPEKSNKLFPISIENRGKPMNKFWNWIKDEDGGRTLRLEGPIDNENFWGDEITPQMFRDELEAGDGDVTVWINSPGGNVFAAAEIYTMLKEYAGKITVKIASIAASAASVIAMAGDVVQMSPTALLMIHDPSTIAMGNARDMEKAIDTLNEVKESIINAYAAKTGLRHSKISDLMESETWMNAKKALDLGFCDEILYTDEEPEEAEPVDSIGLYSSRQMDLAIMNRLGIQDITNTERESSEPEQPKIGLDGKTEDGSMPYDILAKQLELLR